MDEESASKFRMRIGDAETDPDATECSATTERDGDATLTSSPLSFIQAATQGCSNQQPITVLLECPADSDCVQSEYGEGSTGSNQPIIAMSIHAAPVPSSAQKLNAGTIGGLPSHGMNNLTVNNGNRQISACSSHSNSNTSLESFVVVHTELIHPSMAIDELEEQFAVEQSVNVDTSRRLPSNDSVKSTTTSNTTVSESANGDSRSSSALGVAANLRSDTPDAEMNRMLLAAYTKLTTASSSRQTKARSASIDDGSLTSSSSSIDSASGTVRNQQAHDARPATVELPNADGVNIPRVSVVRTPQRGATRRTLPESDLDSLDELESHTSTLTNLNDVRRTAHPHYRHRPNQRVDSALNELVLIAVVLVFGMLIGRFSSTTPSSTVSEAFERSASSHLEQLKAMHDELVTCLKRSGQLELTLHDTRSTMVQREYVEKWEALYDEARERNEALEQSYDTYKRRYLLASASQRSLRRALHDARLQLARTQLRYAYLAERLRMASQELSDIRVCTQPSTSLDAETANNQSSVDSASNPGNLVQLPLLADENVPMKQVITPPINEFENCDQPTEQEAAHEQSNCAEMLNTISIMEQVQTVTPESDRVVNRSPSEESTVASVNDGNGHCERELCTIAPAHEQITENDRSLQTDGSASEYQQQATDSQTATDRPGSATDADQYQSEEVEEPLYFRMSQHRESQRLRNEIQDEQQPALYFLRRRRAAQLEAQRLQRQYKSIKHHKSASARNADFVHDDECESPLSTNDDYDDDKTWKQRHKKRKHKKAQSRKLVLQPTAARDYKNRADSWIPKCKHCRLPRPPGAESTRKSKRKHHSFKSATW